MSSQDRLRQSSKRTPSVGTGAEAVLGEFRTLAGGRWVKTNHAIEVRSPFDDSLVAVTHRAGPAEIEASIDRAHLSFKSTRKIPSWKRSDILDQISQSIGARKEDFARTISLEAGKPIRTARVEVDRAIFTFKVAAEETKRIYGEIVPLDWLPGLENCEAMIRRVPIGPVVGITPFNFPLNLVAHKVAPALAAGNPIIIRPASQTPLSAIKLGELILETDWPEGAFSVVPSTTDDAAPLVTDDRIRKLSFTGSPAVGWQLKAQAGRKKVTLELGGNAGVIVHQDADLLFAAERIASGGFAYAGQSCISVQRVYAHTDIYEEFVDALVTNAEGLIIGDPLDETTDVGPVIDRSAAQRIEQWIQEAVEEGAQLLTGGSRQGTTWPPTILASIEEHMKVSCQEVFGPVIGLYRYTNVREAIEAVDNSEFGLQAGLFTNDWGVIQEAFDDIEVGGLMVNDAPTFRVDHMPYGGVKESGLGREGLRYAIEDMTELKLMMLNNRGRIGPERG